MGSLLLRWFLSALALLAVAYLYPGVRVDGFFAAAVAALVLGLVNAVVRPILVVLTLPVTILTLGLFLFVINAFIIIIAGHVVAGFKVESFWYAMLFSIVLSLFNSFVHKRALREERRVDS